MADLNKILDDYKTQIDKSTPRGPSSGLGRIARSGPKRPWNKDAPPHQGFSGAQWDFDGDETESIDRTKVKPWFSTGTGFSIVAGRRKKFLAASLVASALALGGLSTLIKSTYNSLLLVYMPTTKEGDIGPKLDNLAQDLKIVSTPNGRKVPTFYYAQRVKSPEMRASVMAAYTAAHGTSIDPSRLEVEAIYNPAVETMALRVFYPNPETAAELANIYGERFSAEFVEGRKAYYRDLLEWTARTKLGVSTEISLLDGELGRLKNSPRGSINYSGVIERFNESLGEKEVALTKLKDDERRLGPAVAANDMNALLSLPIDRFATFAEMRRQLVALGRPASELAELHDEVTGAAAEILQQKRNEIRSLGEQIAGLKQGLRDYRSRESEHSSQLIGTNEVEQRLQTKRAQVAALDDLDRQINLKAGFDTSPLMTLEAPRADAGSVFPKPTVRVVMVFVLAALATLLLLGICQRISPIVSGASEIQREFHWPASRIVVEREQKIQTAWKRLLAASPKKSGPGVCLVAGSHRELAIYFAHASLAAGERCLVVMQSGLELEPVWAESVHATEAGPVCVTAPGGTHGETENFLVSVRGAYDRIIFVVTRWEDLDCERLASLASHFILTAREGDEISAWRSINAAASMLPAPKWALVAKAEPDSLLNSLNRMPPPLTRRRASELGQRSAPSAPAAET